MHFEKHKDKIIILLLLIIAGLLLFIIVNQNKSSPVSDRNSARRSQLADSQKAGIKEVDPYEKNEVKNTIIKGAADSIQTCYKDWLKENPNFTSGFVTVDWQIELDGTVIKPEVVSSEIAGINQCVVNSIQKLKFPPPPSDKPWYIVHKFFFKKEEDAKSKK